MSVRKTKDIQYKKNVAPDRKQQQMDKPDENRDWRLPNNISVREDAILPSGIKIPKGARVNIVGNIAIDKRHEVTFTIPNASALFLNASFKSAKRASEIKERSALDKQGLDAFKHEPDIFDFYEERFSSIILAFNAIESFANDMIPENYQYVHHKRSQVLLDLTDKERIERLISLDEKLSAVLPDIFSCPPPKNYACWEKYKKLRQIRDRITHLKSGDRRFIQGTKSNIWVDVFPMKRPHEAAFSIIYYFAKHQNPLLPWLQSFDEILKSKENYALK